MSDLRTPVHYIVGELNSVNGVTAKELMEMTFSYEDALDDLCALVDSEACTPNCLFGMEEGSCACRCQGVHHGQARLR